MPTPDSDPPLWVVVATPEQPIDGTELEAQTFFGTEEECRTIQQEWIINEDYPRVAIARVVQDAHAAYKFRDYEDGQESDE